MDDPLEYRIILDRIDSDDESDEGPDPFEPESEDEEPHEGLAPYLIFYPRPVPSFDLNTFQSTNKIIQLAEEPPPSEPPGAPFPKRKGQNSIGARIQALTKWTDGIEIPEVTQQTGVSRASLYKFRTKAISRGWMPEGILETFHIDDAPRSGRPKISTATSLLVIKIITKNSTTRGYSCKQVSDEIAATPGMQNASPSTVYRILTAEGYRVFKRTVKPGLKEEDKKARLKWCLEHQNWTLEDWMDVIWTDETSVQMGGVRGKRRCWRKKEEAYHVYVVDRRWKGFSEFMWWSCFSYYEKGPYHIWEEETAAEKASCKKDLIERNAARLESDILKWEAVNIMRRLHATRAQSGTRATFKHTKLTGAYVRDKGKGGIDWYRYQEKILKKILLPFAKFYKEKHPGTLVQEDNAPPHATHYQQEQFDLWEVVRLLWVANSPDLNAIEPTWFWMKRETTKKGPITSQNGLKKAWIQCWQDMPQEKIQAWIRRIPVHIEEIIKCEGNNLYKEGSKAGQENLRVR